MMGMQDNPNEEDDDEPKKSQTVATWTHRPMQGELPLKVALKDVIAKEDERLLIDSLLEYSEEDREEGLIGTLLCGDWRDAVTGWSLTRPNVKYAWIEKSKERKQRNASQSKKKQPEERSWKTKIEPGTYKYNPDCGIKLQPEQMILQKRQVDPNLQHHIDKVREHLERTLKKQSDGMQESKKPEPLPGIEPKQSKGDTHDEHKHGHYVVTMTQKGRRHSIESDVKSNDHFEIGDGDAGFHRNGLGRQSDTKLMNHGKKPNRHKLHKYPQPHDTKAPVDLVTALGQKLNEILMEDKLKSLGGIGSLPLSRKLQKSSLFNSPATNSYERFPTTEMSATLVEQPLKPLTKVTPHQRQVHDDNEIIAISSSRLDKSAGALWTAESSTGSLAIPFYTDITEGDSPNKDFIHIGISGHRVQSSKMQRNEPARRDSPTSQVSHKKNRTSGSSKLHKLPLTHGNNDSSHQGQMADGKTGGEMHRGIMDRESAATLAAALMPGVSGRKIEVPNI